MTWLGPFNSFPREMGFPQRSCVVYNIDDFLKKVNTYNCKSTVYSSLYSFNHINPNGKPDYSSAEIEHIYFDLDNGNCLENVIKLHHYFESKKIIHVINFSGAGFHIFAGAEGHFLKNKKSAIFNAVMDIADKNQLKVGIDEHSDIDAHTVGDVARLVRVPNTYNIKRKRFCIPIWESDLKKSLDEIKTIAGIQRPLGIIYGRNSIDLTPYDCEPREELRIPAIELGDSVGIENINVERFPSCIKSLLTKRNIKHRERFLVITYCKEMGIPLKDTILLLRKYLEPRVWNHCVNEERQPIFIYRRADLGFPKCERIQGEGLCIEGCSLAN